MDYTVQDSNSPGRNTGVGNLSLLQGIFPTQGSNPGLPYCRQILYQLSHKGSPRTLEWVAYPSSSGSSQPRNWTRASCIASIFFTNAAIREVLGKVDWYSNLFKNFSQFVVIHTVQGFGIVNKAEIDVFLELSCFSYDPVDVGSLISGSSAFSKSSLNISKFSVHVLLKPCSENFQHYFTSMWDECNCAVVWTFFGIAFLWDWNENCPFPVLWPLLSFPNLLAYWV